MNGINIISLLAGTGAATPPKPLTGAQAPQGLAGFLNLVFTQITAPAAPAAAPGAKAPLQNLPDLSALAPTTAATADALAEKIAALLQSNPADIAGINGLLQNISPQDRQGLAEKVAALLQSPSQGPSVRPATLIQDHTAALAPALQETPSAPQPSKAPDEAELAALLNALQPGSGDAGSSKIMQFLAAQEAGTEPQPAILEQLKASLAESSLTNGAINKDTLVTFKAEITQFLQEQGLDPASIQQHLTTLAKALRPAPAQNAPAQAQAQALFPATTQFTADEQLLTSGQNGQQALQKQVANEAAGVRNVPPSLAAAIAPQNVAPAMPAAPAKPAIPPMTSHPALVNALTGGGNGTSGFESGSFGQQSGQQVTTPDTSTLMSDSLKANNDVMHQGFTNYMQAARQGQSATTQMVALQIQRNAAAKMDTFTMQLNPAELGKLEIRLKFGKDGVMKAHLIADKPETLALLQKDSAHLERVLQHTGLDMEENALSFDLRQNDQQNRQLQDRENNDTSGNDGDFAQQLNGIMPEKKSNALLAVQTYGTISPNGVNITV